MEEDLYLFAKGRQPQFVGKGKTTTICWQLHSFSFIITKIISKNTIMNFRTEVDNSLLEILSQHDRLFPIKQLPAWTGMVCMVWGYKFWTRWGCWYEKHGLWDYEPPRAPTWWKLKKNDAWIIEEILLTHKGSGCFGKSRILANFVT